MEVRNTFQIISTWLRTFGLAEYVCAEAEKTKVDTEVEARKLLQVSSPVVEYLWTFKMYFDLRNHVDTRMRYMWSQIFGDKMFDF